MARCNYRLKWSGMVVLAAVMLLVSSPVETAKKFSGWSVPVNLGPVVNSASEEFLPEMSKNGLSLYFTSDRDGGENIWVSQRAATDDSWGPPIKLGPAVNTSFNERSPGLSRDGHYLFFATNRAGGSGAFDIWVSWRAQTHDDFGWQSPINLGTGVNSAAGDFGPAFFENDEVGTPILFFGSSRAGFGGVDIYNSALGTEGTFGSAVSIAELNTPQNDFRPTIRPDGLELFFDSNRAGPPDVVGIGARDLWVAVRETVSGTWSTPEHLGPVVNTTFNDSLPALSSDGMALIFGSDRPGGFGGTDFYMTTRTKN